MLSTHDKCLHACLDLLILLLLSPSNRVSAQAWKIALIVPLHELQAVCSPGVPGGLKNKPQEAHDGVERDRGQARTTDGDKDVGVRPPGKIVSVLETQTTHMAPFESCLEMGFHLHSSPAQL